MNKDVPRKNLLDQALEYYDIKARNYFQAKTGLENAPKELKESRAKELEVIRAHLRRQKTHATVVASIQAKLDAYQDEGRRATEGSRSEVAAKQRALQEEKHHPSSTLAENMRASCNPQPCPSHSPHHIVPGKGYTPEANLSRVHLHSLGIRINDPDNGVWLPRSKRVTPLWSMPNALAHKQYHTHHYEFSVHARITLKDEENTARRELRFIAKLLQHNKFPIHPEA